MFANSHCNSVLTVLKAYVAWQFLTFVMTLRPVSLYSYCSLWSFFLSTTWECSTFCSKDRASTLSPLTIFQNSLTLGASPTLIVPYSLFITFFWALLWSRHCSASEFFLNSFIYLSIWIRLYIYPSFKFVMTLRPDSLLLFSLRLISLDYLGVFDFLL